MSSIIDISGVSDVSSELSSEYNTLKSFDGWETTTKVAALKVASYLTDPICKVREYFYTFYILHETCKTTSQKAMNIMWLTFGMIGFAILTPFTAPIGAAIRGIVSTLESRPYIYLKRDGKGKILPDDKKITLVSHNQCYMPAGFSITDGQVTPASDRKRMDANIQKLKCTKADILCIYEVPDICDAEYISSQLIEYPFVIPVAGIRGVGPSSMMYVASKYEIDSIEFVPFKKDTELTGRARFSEKGFLSFDIKSCGNKTPFATVISTHLQHSEIPAAPISDDTKSRAIQMNKIANHIKTKIKQGHAVIFTGDLNQNETELKTFLKTRQINWLRRDPLVEGKTTWDGDQWCAKLTRKPVSGSLVLDYTFIAGKATSISTQIMDTGYSGLEFRKDATSDHALLFSTITVE